MNRNVPLISVLTLLLAVPGVAGDRKKHADRAMIEKMETVPCGAHERGLTGLGSVFGSVGVTHVNSDEKLCPQHMLELTIWSTMFAHSVKSIPSCFLSARKLNSN
jgi:hypothetical protein